MANHATESLWNQLQERDEKEAAETLERVVSALVQAVNHNLMSQESAVDYLASFIETMSTWENDEGEGEKERIIQSSLRQLYLHLGMEPGRAVRAGDPTEYVARMLMQDCKEADWAMSGRKMEMPPEYKIPSEEEMRRIEHANRQPLLTKEEIRRARGNLPRNLSDDEVKIR